MSSGDFEPAFRQLLGARATLSASTILRLKADWETDYRAFRGRPITGRFAYVWADGIYLGAGLEPENSCLLVIVGAREDGRKELLGMTIGYRESTESWADVLRDLRERGLGAPLLAVGDGGLGEIWHAELFVLQLAPLVPGPRRTHPRAATLDRVVHNAYRSSSAAIHSGVRTSRSMVPTAPPHRPNGTTAGLLGLRSHDATDGTTQGRRRASRG